MLPLLYFNIWFNAIKVISGCFPIIKWFNWIKEKLYIKNEKKTNSLEDFPTMSQEGGRNISLLPPLNIFCSTQVPGGKTGQNRSHKNWAKIWMAIWGKNTLYCFIHCFCKSMISHKCLQQMQGLPFHTELREAPFWNALFPFPYGHCPNSSRPPLPRHGICQKFYTPRFSG